MVNLAALVLIVMSSTQQPAVPVNDPPPAKQVLNTPAPTARQLTPVQKAWFAHAVDHILTGD